MNKEEKKRLLKNWKDSKKQKFEDSLPMSRKQFRELFDYLDEQLESNGCNRDFTWTTKFLNAHRIPSAPVIAFLKENGGYCDCEALMNVEDRLEHCLF